MYMRAAKSFFVLLVFGMTAAAGPITWTLSGVSLPDGSTASGSFTFDFDAGPADCSTGFVPCGSFSNVDITTTSGSDPAETYTAICQYPCEVAEAPADALGVGGPDQYEVTFQTASPDSDGFPSLDLQFGGAGLTDAGGSVPLTGLTEAFCTDETDCSANLALLVSSGGSVEAGVAAPEPSCAPVLGIVLGAVFFARRKYFQRAASR
jgi:hypothetical protein